MTTQDVFSTPQKVPLPPSPPGSAHHTPGLGFGIEQTLSPYPDLLITPSTGLADKDHGPGQPSSNHSSLFGTSSKRSARQHISPGQNGDERRPGRRAVLEDFELIRVIGKGCAGRVMMVRHTASSRVHAMKAISKRSVLTHDELQHTLTEVKVMKYFTERDPDNPFIAKLDYSFTDKENIYFVMEFYPGGDLATQMEIQDRIGATRTRFYACDIAMGLEDLHRHGIIVRDLKPENVLLNRKGHAVLADFGLSKDFGYRGEPERLLVPSFPGEPAVPYWAGAGAGSIRPGKYGMPRVTVDRAYSFIGTPEYISPEVVMRREHSYAIDWWGLGCIVVEALLGRVPFRKHDWEDIMLLWDRIIYDPWQDVLQDPKIADLDLEECGLDEVAAHFIDGLLQKDPLRRLTEPYVRGHPYFQPIDWDEVRMGTYLDPHDLIIHDDPELNTIYWPKLCLDMAPTVDMLSHDDDMNTPGPADPRTPLNDDRLYAFEQLKARAEFEEFSWTRPETPVDESAHEEAEVGYDGEPLTWSVSEYTEQLHDLAAGMPSRTSIDYASEPRASMDASALTTPDISPKVERPESIASPRNPDPQIPDDIPSVPSVTTPSPVLEPLEPAPPVDPVSPIATLSPATNPTSSPIAIKVPSPRNIRDLALPHGLPATGLSSSDVVSIPSPDPQSPTRLIRRHTAAQPSIDTNANSRLSVDLHGTISRLGEDDWEWEQLDLSSVGGSIPSVPNAAPSAFFSRRFGHVLGRGRRPSTLVTSGLRRQVKTSDSSRESSSPTNQRQLFTVKSIENTKKVFKKAFPKRMKRDSKTGEAGNEKGRVPSTATSVGGARSPSPNATPPRPTLNPRSITTESVSMPNTATVPSSWFNTKRNGRSVKRSITSSSSSASSTNLAASTSHLTLGPGGVPRVELTHTPPIVWELDGSEKAKTKVEGAGEAVSAEEGDKIVAPLLADVTETERSRST